MKIFQQKLQAMSVVLLVSNDSDLATAVESAAASVRRCQTRWITDLGDLGSSLRMSRFAWQSSM